MNTNNSKLRAWLRRITGLTTAVVMMLGLTGNASARILFEDDQFFNVNSEGIILDFNDDVGSANEDISLQFGNDGSDASIDYNGSTGDITLSTPGGDFDFSDDNVAGTGGLDFDGNVNFTNASEFHMREVADEAAATCTTLDEVVLDTTENTIYVCTGVGAPGTWTNAASAAGTDLQGAYDADASGAHEIVLATGDGEAVEIRADAAGDDLLELQNAAATNLVRFSDLAGTTLDIDSLIVDWDATGAFDLDSTSSVSIGAAGAASDFTLAADGAGDDLTIAVTGAFDSSVVLDSAGTGTDAVDINATAGGVTIDSAGATSIDAVGASNFTTDSGALTLSSTTSGNVAVNAADDATITAGDDIIFDDAQLVGVVQVSEVATDWNATFSSDGIVDNINSFTSTANGEGASNVGVEDASGWFTGAEIEAALNEIEALFGSTTSSTFNFTEDNVLADNDDVYTALNKLDLKWGDLASTANGEGASLVGIEDAAGDFTATTVEGALAELAADIGNNYEDLTFYPEYPDAVVHADGTTNRGTLESFYDSTEETGYYNWTTRRATTQDIDIRFAFPLPTDFNATGDFTFRYRTGTTTEADNDVEVRLYNVTNTTECANDLTNGTAGTWATGTIAAATINAGCTGGTALDAGDIVEVQIKLYDNSGAADYADIGRLIWDYTK